MPTVRWLLAALRRSAPGHEGLLHLAGQEPGGEATIDAPGYRHSRPARSGNAAAGQTQLGTYGDLLDTIRRYVSDGHVLDDATGRLLTDGGRTAAATHGCRRTRVSGSSTSSSTTRSRRSGAGPRSTGRRQLAEDGQLPDGSAPRWRAEAEEIKAWVDTHCWSDDRQAYTFYAGTDDLDAAVLLAGRTGFERGPRLASTIDAVTADPRPGTLRLSLQRHGARRGRVRRLHVLAGRSDGVLRAGSSAPGRSWRRRSDAPTTSACYSEMIDPATGEFLGNIPQALSHLSLINAAHTLTARGVT